jgi:uncharacterized membrane protein YwaF
MTSCTIEKLFWVISLIAVLSALYLGEVRTVGMIVTVAAAVWYGVICPFANELWGLNWKRKGSVN